MKARFFQFVLFSLFIGTTSFAQFNETIVSDRPGQSNSPYTLGKKVLQFQTGIQFGGDNADNYKSNDFLWPAVIRFGIAEKVDLITVLGYQSLRGESDYINQEYTANGINETNFGLRFNIFEETDKAPALGFEAYYKTELTSSDFKPDYPSAKLNLMASKTVSDLLGITSNLGLDVDGSNGGSSNGFYTLNFVLTVNDVLGVFFENYGNFTYESFDTYFDFGTSFILNPNLQLDLFGGFGYNDDTFSYLVSGGVSYRIIKWRKSE